MQKLILLEMCVCIVCLELFIITIHHHEVLDSLKCVNT